ncbi:MAG: pyrroloquinoline quinone biosynthesis protein PqqB [Candidatus Acidiferrales bacterium]
MRVKVLGSAAGGGFPQWNCACRNCRRLRDGSVSMHPRTQTQVAVCSSANEWFLLNASPDLRSQILSTPQLAPAKGPRDTPIEGVWLTSADVDSVAGLLHLREFQPLNVYATPSVRRVLLEDNRIFRVLERSSPPACWQEIPLNTWLPFTPGDDSSDEGAIRVRATPLGGSYPDYVSEGLRRSLDPEEAVIGLALASGKKHFFYAPSIGGRSGEWKEWARASDLCLIDGTFWDDKELISAGASSKSAREIGHMPLSGKGGLLEEFGTGRRGKRVLIHINNTNPILDEESAEYREVRRAGWEIAYDGMEFEL